MRRFKAVKGAGPWKFSPQGDKYGYINNPRWTEVMAHEDDHEPCGYWPKQPSIPYLVPNMLPIWEPNNMNIDIERRKLYTVCSRHWVGTKYLRKVFETDLDTFKHTRVWGLEIPGHHDVWGYTGPYMGGPYFHDSRATAHFFPKTHHGDQHLTLLNPVGNHCEILNGRTGDIRRINLAVGGDTDYVHPAGVTTYCAMLGGRYPFPPGIASLRINAAQNRMYVYRYSRYFYRRNLVIGYIDLDSLEWTLLVYECNTLREAQIVQTNISMAPFQAWPEHNMLVVSAQLSFNRPWGVTRVWDMEGNLRGHFTPANTTDYPERGLGVKACHKGWLYGSVSYRSQQPHQRGLCRLNVNSGAVEYYQPPYAPNLTTYRFTDMTVVGDKLYMSHSGYGFAEFDMTKLTWRFLNDWEDLAVHPLLKNLYGGPFNWGIHYDPGTECIYGGYGTTLWQDGPWARGLADLQWMPNLSVPTSLWRSYIARHSVLGRPLPGTEIPETIIDAGIKVPMIWTTPSND